MTDEDFHDFILRLKNIVGGQQLQIGHLQYDAKMQAKLMATLASLIADSTELQEERGTHLHRRINELEEEAACLRSDIAYLKAMVCKPTRWERFVKHVRTKYPQWF